MVTMLVDISASESSQMLLRISGGRRGKRAKFLSLGCFVMVAFSAGMMQILESE